MLLHTSNVIWKVTEDNEFQPNPKEQNTQEQT